MRNVVLGLGVTLDSYIARRAGAVDFLFMPRDFSMADFFASVIPQSRDARLWTLGRSGN
jgi:hypothetical protein